MTRHFNTRHYRSRSTYDKKQKDLCADRYGIFKDGSQKSPDRIAGKTLYYRDQKEEPNP